MSMSEQKYAYVDWDKVMSREPPDFRYRSYIGVATAKEYEDAGVAPECGNDLEKSKVLAGQRLVDFINDGPYKPEQIARETGCSKALFSRMRSGKKPFCVPAKSWETLAYQFMHISVHDLILGEKRPLILPKKYSVTAYYFAMLPEADQKRLVERSRQAVRDYYEQTPDESGHHRPCSDLIKERITDIMEHYGYYKYRMFGDTRERVETPNVLTPKITSFWFTGDHYEPQSGFLCYAALCYKDQNLDYLICEDPMRGYFDTYAESPMGDRILLTGDAHEFWRDVLIVDQPRKEELLTMALASVCQLMVTGE